MPRFFWTLFLLPVAFAIADEHAPVSNRSIPTEAIERLQKQRQIKGADLVQTDISETTRCYWHLNQTVCYPASSHWISVISPFGDSLGIEDGSIWQISCADAPYASRWLASDPVVVTQNNDWLSFFKYKIFNKNDGECAVANLSQGPILNGEFSRRVAMIDLLRGHLILSDNTHWTVSWLDDHMLSNWAIDDYVIVGINSGWDSSCQFILINPSLNDFIRVKQN